MEVANPLCLPEGVLSPPGLDPREEFEALYLIEAVSREAPGEAFELPDIPVDAILAYLLDFQSSASTPLSVAKGFIDAEVLGTHAAMRGVAEALRRDLVQAVKMYEAAGKKVTPEIRAFVEAAQASSRTSLSKLPIHTRSWRLLNEAGVSLQFGAVTRPWEKGVRQSLMKVPIQLYSPAELLQNPALASNKQAYFRNSQGIITVPKKISGALKAFDTMLFAVEVAPSVYHMYNAITEGDMEELFKSSVATLATAGGELAKDVTTRVGFSFCVELGVATTAVATPAVSLPLTVACGVGAVIAGIYVGDRVKNLPTTLTPVENLTLHMP